MHFYFFIVKAMIQSALEDNWKAIVDDLPGYKLPWYLTLTSKQTFHLVK